MPRTPATLAERRDERLPTGKRYSRLRSDTLVHSAARTVVAVRPAGAARAVRGPDQPLHFGQLIETRPMPLTVIVLVTPPAPLRVIVAGSGARPRELKLGVVGAGMLTVAGIGSGAPSST